MCVLFFNCNLPPRNLSFCSEIDPKTALSGEMSRAKIY